MLLLALLVCFGCRRRVVDHLQTGTLRHGELEREFHVYLPPGHDENNPAPLVIALHGGGGRGARLDETLGGAIVRQARQRGWVVVFPEGIAHGWNDGREAITSRDQARASVDDVAFIGALIDRLKADHGIDEKRVYVTGISNGGSMTYRVGIELGDRVAAIAPVTASLGKVIEDSKPVRRIPILIMNGTADPLVPYTGGQVTVLGKPRGEILSTNATVRWFTKLNGCTGGPQRDKRPDIAMDSTAVTVDTYDSCQDDTEVQLFRINGGGHAWPGGRQYLPVKMIGTVCRDIDGAAEIFAFFERHALP
jgi:polyhydroxybutyrate depolymerase